MLELERGELAAADAVLARAGAAARERVDDQPLDELVGERSSAGSSGSTCRLTWTLPSPAWPRIAASRPRRSASARANATAPASSETGTHVSVARSCRPGAAAAAA